MPKIIKTSLTGKQWIQESTAKGVAAVDIAVHIFDPMHSVISLKIYSIKVHE